MELDWYRTPTRSVQRNLHLDQFPEDNLQSQKISAQLSKVSVSIFPSHHTKKGLVVIRRGETKVKIMSCVGGGSIDFTISIRKYIYFNSHQWTFKLYGSLSSPNHVSEIILFITTVIGFTWKELFKAKRKDTQQSKLKRDTLRSIQGICFSF